MLWNSHRDESNEDLKANKEWTTLRFPGILPQKVQLPGTLSCSDWLAVTGEGIGKAKFIIFGFRIINLNLYFPICVKQQNTCVFFVFLNHTYFVRMKPLCQLTKERFLRLFSSFPLSQKWQVFKARIKKKKCGMVWNQWELLSIKTTCPHTEIQDNTTGRYYGSLN